MKFGRFGICLLFLHKILLLDSGISDSNGKMGNPGPKSELNMATVQNIILYAR